MKYFFFQIVLISMLFIPFSLSSNNSIANQTIFPAYVPYVDICQWPPFDISAVDSTGICLYTLAFIVDDQFQDGANPCWGGYSNLDMTWYVDKINTLRENGGDIIISFGGASGQPLAYTAADENELFNAYKTVIDSYQISSLDFDIEGMFVAHPSSIERRSKAMKLLQQAYPGLQISLTLPVMPTGLTGDGINVIKQALLQNVDISLINLMTMDYGGDGDMGDNAISALNATFTQIKNLYQEQGLTLPDSAIWRKLGATPMIGQNDVASEVFYTVDALDLRNFAFEKKIGRLSIWSANRDKQCENSSDPLYKCSHIEQEPFEFSSIFQMDGTIHYCDETVGESEFITEESVINLFPNPAHGSVTISGCEKASVLLLNLSGKQLSKVSLNNKTFNISGYSPGLYIVKIETPAKSVFKKLIIY
jgi:chitinase